MGADADAYQGNCCGNTEDEEQNDPGWRSSRWRRLVFVHAVSIVASIKNIPVMVSLLDNVPQYHGHHLALGHDLIVVAGLVHKHEDGWHVILIAQEDAFNPFE